HSSNLSFAVWPAKTSNQEIFFLPPKAFSTAASNTRWLAAQMSGPVPSPRMNGITGLSGTMSLPLLIVIFPPAGGVIFFYDMSKQMCFYYINIKNVRKEECDVHIIYLVFGIGCL